MLKMKTIIKFTGLVSMVFGLFSTVWAASPPSTSAYATDITSEYVQDSASDGLNSVNMVLCIMKGLAPGLMLTNHGTVNSSGASEVSYTALVDKNKCDTSNQSSVGNSTSNGSGSSSTPLYMNAIVDVTRASSSAPMAVKAWMTMTENSVPTKVYVLATATTDPTSLPPYGKVRVDYAGYANGALQFNGFVDANGSAVSQLETGPNSNNTALALAAASTNSGSGVLQTSRNGLQSYKFAYGANYFARNAGSGDVCFDRTKANATKSVWRYGTYDATSGNRVDLSNPGFPISGSYLGSSQFGFASYWGVNFGGVDPSTIATLGNGQITAVTNITDQRPNNTTSYNLFKNNGRLTKWAQQSISLSDLNGVNISIFGEGCKLVGGNNAFTPSATATPAFTGHTANNCQNIGNPDYQNWQIQWDSTMADPSGAAGNGNFKLVGVQLCNSGTCVNTQFNTTTPVKQGWKNMAINGYSDALGNINIPLAPGNSMNSNSNSHLHTGTDTAYYFTQSAVIPAGSLNLVCLSNCPTHTSLSALTSNSNASPFDSATTSQWGSGSNLISYVFGSNGLTDGGVSTTVTSFATGSPYSMMGVSNGGRLYETTDMLSGTACQSGIGYCEPASPTSGHYYTYQTGSQQWNQSYWLQKTSDNSVVTFDPPSNLSYAVPITDSSSYAGMTVNVQFMGFGNLGIPGYCVNPQTNVSADCSVAGVRYVPAFVIPDGSLFAFTHTGGTQVLTKALNSEIRLSNVSCTTAGLNTSGVTLSLPTQSAGNPANPSLSSDVSYIGIAPALTSAPAVVDGVLQ
jgi:hypothetical protein